MRAYKYLVGGGRGRFSDVAWPPPVGDRPGEWLEVEPPLDDCLNGIHACAAHQLLDWIDDELWEIELAGEIDETGALLVAERGRLLGRISAWDGALACEFAEVCAWRARQQALSALREFDLTDEAQELVAAAELSSFQSAAAAAATTSVGTAAEATALAADIVSLTQGQRPESWLWGIDTRPQAPPAVTAANVAFVVAHAVGLRAANSGADYGDAFAAERAWQLDWLVGRLGLAAA
jgi:hypothetical protein